MQGFSDKAIGIENALEIYDLSLDPDYSEEKIFDLLTIIPFNNQVSNLRLTRFQFIGFISPNRAQRMLPIIRNALSLPYLNVFNWAP